MHARRSLAAVLLVVQFLVGTGLAPRASGAALAEPTLTLTPNQAPCGATVVAHGAGFPVGRTVAIVASGGDTKPIGGAPATAVAAADGTFALDLVPCAGALPGADPDGAQYVVAASVASADPFAPPEAFARAIFTVGPVAQAFLTVVRAHAEGADAQKGGALPCSPPP